MSGKLRDTGLVQGSPVLMKIDVAQYMRLVLGSAVVLKY